MGFNVENDLFANHSWYFRNALVRANYQNIQKGIKRESVYLERFFRNLLMGENNELRDRFMVVNIPENVEIFTPTSTPTSSSEISSDGERFGYYRICCYNYLYIMKYKYTPEFIDELESNEIFVFGSNLAGMHGGGAARFAYKRFGAVWGQGVGLQGQSYAIPTMQGGVETIRPYVDEFIVFAKAHPEYTFLVTPIGCGIAGFKEEEIAPLFKAALKVENIVLPEAFVALLN